MKIQEQYHAEREACGIPCLGELYPGTVVEFDDPPYLTMHELRPETLDPPVGMVAVICHMNANRLGQELSLGYTSKNGIFIPSEGVPVFIRKTSTIDVYDPKCRVKVIEEDSK